MSIKVLVADDSNVMLSAMQRTLSENAHFQVVGVSTFAATMKGIADFKPDVLLLDLHLPERREFTPEFVRSQLVSVPHVLAVSLSTNSDAKTLANQYGAKALLDKLNLYSEMIPAIMGCVESAQLDAQKPGAVQESSQPSAD